MTVTVFDEVYTHDTHLTRICIIPSNTTLSDDILDWCKHQGATLFKSMNNPFLAEAMITKAFDECPEIVSINVIYVWKFTDEQRMLFKLTFC
jgi:hypothetical protein